MPRRSEALQRERKRRERVRASAAARSQPETPPTQSVEDLWGKLRQGARNVAGVRWQVAVSVHFLIGAHVGDLPFAVFTPEGLEDLDSLDASGARTHIQMKEVGAGAGRLTAADVADAVVHAAQIPGHVQFVLVTDGDLGSGLQFTGWNQALAAQAGQPLDDVASNLANRGIPHKEALELLGRTHLLRMPWNVRENSELSLVQYGISPAVATFVVSALYDTFAESSAGQRTSTAATAITHRPGDVATAITQVQSVVDLIGLDAAVTAGVCSPADYLHPSELSSIQFYEGVGGAPAHIAAHLDVLRVAEMGHIVDAVDHERYAVIVGPSGSGKSILLWRAARDAVLGARVVRVRRLATDADVDLLVRHVRQMSPSRAARVVVAADDLGRPHMAAWGRAVEELRELQWVFVLGASREEDFNPSLLRGNARVVRPQLDRTTADLIAERIRAAGLGTAMDTAEAWASSEGLLMEFIALLTRAKRLEQVLAEQADALKAPERALERAMARLVLAAHSVGLAVPVDALGQAAEDRPKEAVGDALAVLQGEHVVTIEGEAWRGLHELRSRVLTTLLHQAPPPTLAETWSEVARVLPVTDAGWLLRRIAEQDPEAATQVTGALAPSLASPARTALQVATALEGAERADNAIYAHDLLPIFQREARGGVSVHQLVLSVYPVRHQGMKLPSFDDPQLDASMRHIVRIAAMLPERRQDALVAAASDITPARLVELATSADLDDAVRVLEASAGVITIDPEAARTMIEHFWRPADLDGVFLFARLIEQVSRDLEPPTWAHAIRPFEDRLQAVTLPDPTVIAIDTGQTDDEELVVTVRTMLPPHDKEPVPLSWDAAPRSKREQANDAAVAIANRIVAACPEVQIVEIITVTPSGQRLRIDDLEPGYKRMFRTAFPERVNVRRSVGFQASIRRLTAATTWTDLIRDQAALATDLAALLWEAPARLRPTDSPKYRQQWLERVQELSARAASLSSRPTKVGADIRMSHARADDADRSTDPVSEAISLAANRLPAILDGNLTGTASFLRDARDKLKSAKQAGNIALGDRDELVRPISQEVLDALGLVAQLLYAVARDPEVASRLQLGSLRASAEGIVAEAVSAEAERQDAVLRRAVSPVTGAALYHVKDEQPFFGSLAEKAWLVTAPLEEWNELIEALRSISSEQRMALASNIVAAATDDDAVLPLGVSLTQTPGRLEFPVNGQGLEPFVAYAGLRMAGQAEQMRGLQGFVDHLVTLSWDAARRRARPADWPDLATYDGPSVDGLREMAEQAAHVLPMLLQQEVRTAVAVLAEQVEAEVSADRDFPSDAVTLAGEMFDHALDSDHAGAAAHLWDALSTLSAVVTLGAGGST